MTYPSQQSVSTDRHPAGFEPTHAQAAPSQDALGHGARVAEYEIERVLGEGGFGIVYLAVDHDLQRHVAVKEYLPAALASRGARSQVTLRASSHAETFALGLRSFVNEARLLARFDHPSLVRVYRFWEANGTAYMVMPYYEGPTLAEARLAMRTPPDEAWLRRLLHSLMGALEVLHEGSCYHRDIAPDNILLLPDGRPVLLDFGAARRVIGDKTQTLTAILKPAFAPIEQYAEAGHLQQGPWTDLYALAAVVYYCISGRSPLPSTVRAVDDQLKPLSEVVQSLQATFPEVRYSPGFLAAIDWALSVRPQDRPQNVEQLRQALNRHDGGRPSGPPPAVVAAAAAAPPPVTPSAASIAAAMPPPRSTQPPQEVPTLFSVFPGPDTPRPAAAGAAPGPATGKPDEVPSDAAVMAALNVALGSLPDLKPDPERWTATRAADEDDRAAGRSSGGMVRWGLMLAVLVAIGLGAWKWNERRHAEAVLRQIAGSSLSDPALTQPRPAPPTPGAVPPTPAAVPPAPAPTVATPPAAPPAVAAAPMPPPTPAPAAPAPATPPVDPVAATPAAPPPAPVPAASALAAAPAMPPVAAATTPLETPPPQAAAGLPREEETGAGSTATRRVGASEPSNPRTLCEPRTNFSLYYCMQTQCRKPQYVNHPHCKRLRERDEVE
ncbi:serine/threonine protein kinase [Aquabacterium sp. A7-Y]|uniref:serine/threonine protein kinase n=1 Tax=Aquabacterium sp. A7-Y TaxID=1349605 RepID=UPI00223E6096|nr:serine/threonine-protein kinase [Aquabacterium sp. A7-Y]MCW7539799.1 serine/threonine protein kinase [Aquabacterium sp. A7-Y]